MQENGYSILHISWCVSRAIMSETKTRLKTYFNGNMKHDQYMIQSSYESKFYNTQTAQKHTHKSIDVARSSFT